MKTGQEAFEERNRAVGHHNRGEYTDEKVYCGNCEEKHTMAIIEGPKMGGEPLYTKYRCLGCQNEMQV